LDFNFSKKYIFERAEANISSALFLFYTKERVFVVGLIA